ncbi:type II CRISPR RNA-guided endonuclease Cas9 [Brackiella oedipodis]|uniref:type II CRISPR RNA-guided endonuclease Cas9 n=1 Tax=Brackiella oedipodis TaxID=124225 RepID=UPI00068840C4|nr:type II CRISPR RNA-guided endonuclease Cas9 [Brackiella oedipodis]
MNNNDIPQATDTFSQTPDFVPHDPKILKKEIDYVIGLDIGIASIGWAVLALDEEDKPIALIDRGVRLFDKAETKKGDSLSLARRTARGQRRRIGRRVKRLDLARQTLIEHGVLQPNDLNNNPDGNDFVANRPDNAPGNTVWDLRVKGLDHKLKSHEWAAVLLHLIKRRGYLSQGKSEAKADEETGKLLAGTAENHKKLANGNYRTPAELAVNTFAKESGRIRNQAGSYQHTFLREDLQKELQSLFENQRNSKNPYANETLEKAFDDYLTWQKPALSDDALLKMVGPCTFEDGEKRAAKATYTAERFTWLTKLANLKIITNGVSRELTPEERDKLKELPFELTSLTFSQVRKTLGLDENSRFNLASYKSKKKSKKNKQDTQKEKTKTVIKDAEKETFMECKSYHAIRKALGKTLDSEWEAIKNNPDLLDLIGTTFTIYKTDKAIRKELKSHLSPEAINALQKNLSFTKFLHVSLKMIKKIMPYLEEGMRYDEACKEVYGSHYGNSTQRLLKQFLPPMDSEENVLNDVIRNPVVARAVSQTRKVINAIIRRYGSPTKVIIETGRDLGKSFQERKEIKDHQKENRNQKLAAQEEFEKRFGVSPNGGDLLKMRLYEQQQGKCLYSGTTIELNQLLDKGYVEIDHALPFSRTWDDSFNNKVLVMGSENQNKGNRTPYEYLDGEHDSARWQTYVALVNGSNMSYLKKQRLLTKEIKEDEWKARNLNDTRYIAIYLRDFIKANLLLKSSKENNVLTTNGRVTSLLRGRWGLAKDREANARHHAMDAVVVACTTPSFIQRITNYMKRKEANERLETTDPVTGEVKRVHFPKPWDGFRSEVLASIFRENPQEEIPAYRKLVLDQYLDVDSIKPLFVSRMPRRVVTGEGHEATIRSAKRLKEGLSTVKKSINDLSKSDLERFVNKDREPKFYQILKDRLETIENLVNALNESKNTDEEAQIKNKLNEVKEAPVHKLNNHGMPTGPIVKSIRLLVTPKSGVGIRKGVANNGKMVRVDIFKKGESFYGVPIYAWQVAKGILPNKGVNSKKSENDWELMDESAEFQFSCFKNDLIKIVPKTGDHIFGYYVGFDRDRRSFTLAKHDKGSTNGEGDKSGTFRFSITTMAKEIIKCEIDVLGHTITEVKHEKRLDFSKSSKKKD